MKVGNLIECVRNQPSKATREMPKGPQKQGIERRMDQQSPTMSMHQRVIAPKALVKSVERLHVVVTVLALLAAFGLGSRPHWMGILLGALIGGVNFRGLAMVTQRLTSGETQTKNGAIGLLMGKFLLVGLAIAVILLAFKPNALTLLVGLSFAPICLVLVVLRQPKPSDGAPPQSTVPSQASAPQQPENHSLSQLESP